MDVLRSCTALALGREGEGGRHLPRRGAVLTRLGVPQLLCHLTIMNNDLQAVINGKMTTAQMLADVASSLKG